MAKFIFTWDTGFVSEVELPPTSTGCSRSYSTYQPKHASAMAGLINGASDPTADENSVGYITDKLAYLQQAMDVARSYWGVAKSTQSYWNSKYKDCKGCCSVRAFGTCIEQCCCHCSGSYCDKTQDNLNNEKNNWNNVISSWATNISSIQTLIDGTNTALAEANLQIQTQLEQANQQAQTNEIIAETNIIIAMAKGKELEVEETDRISKFFTIIVPIVVLILLIVMIQIWRKK